MKKTIPFFKLLLFCRLGLFMAPHLTGQTSLPEYRYWNSENLLYVAYIPDEKVWESGEKYPLILYLHGSCAECITHERITQESNFQYWHNFEANTQIEPTFLI